MKKATHPFHSFLGKQGSPKPVMQERNRPPKIFSKMKRRKKSLIIIRPHFMFENLYQTLLSQPKKENQQEIHYYRFKLFLILSRYILLTAGKIGLLTKEKVEEILKTKKLTLGEMKTHRHGTVDLPDKAVNELSKMVDGINLVFDNQVTLRGTKHPRKWIRFINNSLIEATENMNLYIRFELIRASYKTDPLDNVKTIINNKSILTTQHYHRETGEPL